nr:serine/threonine protein kinase [Deltaproteobacteria bacterium]
MASFTDTGSTRGPADVGRVATRRMDAGGDVSESRDGRRDLPGRMGRFVVLETLGEGGMGQVLAAYDPVLDRRVALKRLRSAGDDAGLARLRREARAMARLSHPGVVAVHDVLEVDGDVLVAMEYVEGQTLREWLGDGERPWTAVVKAMGEAGEGLAAAHAAGLVHRDFKPDNVLVGEDQRVQVTDFGLAIMMAEAEIPSTLSRPAVAESGLTQTGALLGTPRYMAPEQFRGEPADARSDQFSFCVSLYQALYGQDPFEGKTLAALEHAVLEDEPHSPPSDRGVPGWLGTVVLRGLARDPAARWPSMRALVAELSRERRRGRWLSAAGAGLLLASAGTWWSLAGTEDQRCTGAPRELAPLWSEPRQQRLRAVMQETALPGAEATWTVVQRGVQAWADDWQSGYTDACQAHLRGEQSDRVLDRRMACLDRQRRSVGAALRVLEQPDARVLRRAPRAVGELPVPSDCTQVERLAAVESWFEDPALAGRRDDLRDRLAKLAAEATWAGRFKDAIAGYGAMLDALDPIPAPALRAELLYQRGSARSVSDSIDAAKADLLAAYAQAERARVDPLKARIAADLVELVPRRGLALPDVDAWAALALAIVERAEPNGGAHGHVLSALAKLRHHQGRYEDALALARPRRICTPRPAGPCTPA